MYFSPSRDVAEDYGHNGQIFEAHVRLNNPFYLLGNPGFDETEAKEFMSLLKEQGYDGIIHYNNVWSVENSNIGSGEVIVFNNSSIIPAENTSLQSTIEEAEAETDTNPTDGQKEAGNYKMYSLAMILTHGTSRMFMWLTNTTLIERLTSTR
mgnify:CR=1 FL=1